MNTIFSIRQWARWALLLLMGVMVCTACSDDNEGGGVKPAFPGPFALQCSPKDGKPGEVSFQMHADGDWLLNADRIWCQFKDKDGNVVRTLSGAAGDYTVTVVVNSDAQNFSDATANLPMTMAGFTDTVATVNRSPKGYQVIAYKDKETEVITAQNPVAFTYRPGVLASQTFHVKANFDWQMDVKKLPSWVTVNADEDGNHLTGKAGEVVTVNVDFSEAASKVNAQNAVFHLLDRAGVEHATIPVTYNGMGDMDIEINSVFNLRLSMDGQSYWTENSTTGDKENQGEGAYKIKVAAKGEIVPCYFEYKTEWSAWNPIQTQWGMPSWFNVATDANGKVVADKDGNISFTVDENTAASRQGMLVLVPKKFFDETLQGDPTNLIVDGGAGSDIDEKYQQYIAAQFTQDGNTSTAGGFKIMNGQTYEEMSVELGKLSDMGLDDETLKAEYGTTNAWVWSASSFPESIVILPNGFTSNADPFFELKNEWSGIEPGSTTWPSAGVTLIIDNAQIDVNKLMQVRFLNTDGSVYATLVFQKFDGRKRNALKMRKVVRKVHKR